MVDVNRLKRSWALVTAHGDEVPLRFYSRLFVASPEIREMFPLSMVAQRDRLVTALGHTVSHIDDFETLAPYLRQLGRDHRKFGVTAEHYEMLGQVLLDTLADFLGREWTPDLAQDWTDAYTVIAGTMIDAAEQAARHRPPWWVAEVTAHQQRTFDIVVLTLQPEQSYPYLPGQSVAIETPQRPRLWRYYSPANAPRHDGSIDLHVRRVAGGQVSGALVDQIQKGDAVRLGAPVGHQLTLPPDSQADLLLIAGGTGLAPLKALTEQTAWQVAAGEANRQVSLYVGARTARELYDLEALEALEAQHPWLQVVPTLSEDPLSAQGQGPFSGGRTMEHGPVGEVALRRGEWKDRDIFVCGSDQMVVTTVQSLREAGCEAGRIRYEGFQSFGGDVYGVIDPGERYQQQ